LQVVFVGSTEVGKKVMAAITHPAHLFTHPL
jgi:acyl-CoA reductase-like NAD-dependent aldehyde dehydrogenase